VRVKDGKTTSHPLPDCKRKRGVSELQFGGGGKQRKVLYIRSRGGETQGVRDRVRGENAVCWKGWEKKKRRS